MSVSARDIHCIIIRCRARLILLHLILTVLAMSGQSASDAGGQENPDRFSSLLSMADSLAEANPDSALPYARKAMEFAAEMDDRRAMTDASRSLGDILFYQQDYQAALEEYVKAAEGERMLHGELSPGHISRLGDVAYCYDMLQKQDEAIAHYRKAYELASKAGIRDEIAANLANIGRIETIRGNYGEAIELMKEALAIDQAIGNDETIATDLNTIGRIYQSWGKNEEAIGYFMQALKLDEAAGRKAKASIRLNSLGLSYKALKQYDEAILHFNRALEIDRELEDDHKVAIRLNNLGNTFAEMGDFRSAIGYLTEAAGIFEQLNLPQELATGYSNLARYNLGIANIDASLSDALKSLTVAEDQKMKPLVMGNHELLSMIYEKRGDFEKAFEHFRKYDSLKNEIFTEDSDRRIAEFMALYETEKERRKNEVLQRDAQILQKKHLVTLISGIAAVVALSMAVVILRLVAQSNRRKKELAEERAEKLDMELETRNKELTYNAMGIIRSNEAITGLVSEIEEALEHDGSPEHIRQIIRGMKSMERNEAWKEFEVRFSRVHEEFYRKLQNRFPDLTPNERKLCAFLRLNMSTKDIANLTHQDVHTILVARTRLRKKLNLANTDENLVAFLASL